MLKETIAEYQEEINISPASTANNLINMVEQSVNGLTNTGKFCVYIIMFLFVDNSFYVMLLYTALMSLLSRNDQALTKPASIEPHERMP